jgi:hypothetical protein
MELLPAQEVQRLLIEVQERRYRDAIQGGTSLGGALKLPRVPLQVVAFVSALTAVAQGLEELVGKWGARELPKLAAVRSAVWQQARQRKYLAMLERVQGVKQQTYLQHWWVKVQ